MSEIKDATVYTEGSEKYERDFILLLVRYLIGAVLVYFIYSGLKYTGVSELHPYSYIFFQVILGLTSTIVALFWLMNIFLVTVITGDSSFNIGADSFLLFIIVFILLFYFASTVIAVLSSH